VDVKDVIRSQYLASLAMLKQAIIKCPQPMWDDPRDKDKFWFKAYHAIYYTHLYLQVSRAEFVRWEKHPNPVSCTPLSKGEVLNYLAFVEQEVTHRVPVTDLEAESGFHGFRINKLELAFVNIRHIQQHAGELYERLGTRKNIKLGWAEHRHRSLK
jgi:hypothetical protein